MPGNIYLCGPPGAGKSTIAPRLAALRGLEAVDVDALIESADGRPVSRIIVEDGEPAFRARERETIHELAFRSDIVVALGAGALEDGVNRGSIARSGVLVFLDATVATCEQRTAHAAGTRPLLREHGALARLHAARRPSYLGAQVRIALDGANPDEVARAIDTALNDERVVRVETAKPYDVVIGPRVIDELSLRVRPHAGGRIFIIADQAVLNLAYRAQHAYQSANLECDLMAVAADEKLKSLDTIGQLYEWFVERRVDRRGLVVGVGGGTIGDAVGFAAATFQRGVPFVSVPTTLLSAVDAAIGGKTAINLPSGKNLVGTVTQPALVAIDPQVLRTLPNRDIVSGYGEMLKYGLALDAELYRALRAGQEALLDDPASALDAIARCVEQKAEIVARDEEDRTGVRAVLNFGHTVGHALEKVAGYGSLRHGEAVIVGMRAELALSVACGLLDESARADAWNIRRSRSIRSINV